MKIFPAIAVLVVTLAGARGEDWLDRLDESLTFASDDGAVRARLSGLLDIEAYQFSQPSPGFIFSEGHALVNPRLTLFFDAQLGPHWYLFAQSRLDRGFDPADANADLRLDEYAVRWTPWEDGRFNVQVGQFATVVGNWMHRHLSWDNPFMTGPLIYENMTPIYDAEIPATREAFLEGITEDKYEYNPVIWGPSYAPGLAVSGALGKFDYAFEWKNSSLSSRPETWRLDQLDLEHGTFSGRIGYRPNQAWTFGLSASQGAYYLDSVESELPAGRTMNDYKETVLGQDVSFAWHHWQLWAEVYEARFGVPNVGHADVMGCYLEAKYKFSPQFFGALRGNLQLYGDVPDVSGGTMPWGRDTWRIDAAATYRFTAHVQAKLQYSLEHESRSELSYSHLAALQFTVRF